MLLALVAGCSSASSDSGAGDTVPEPSSTASKAATTAPSYRLLSKDQLDDAFIGGVRTEVDGATALSNYALVGPTMVYAGTVSYLSGDSNEAANILIWQFDAYRAAASS